MKRSLLPLVSMLIFVRCITLSAQDTVNVSEFGLKPGTRENAVLLARKALETCRTKSNPVLLFPRGRYDFWPQYAAEKIYYESNTDVIPFRRCAILIENINGLTVECDGSEFIFHDLIQPFTVDRSSNITIRNVSIDWDVPLTAQAEIIENNVFESSGSSILIAGDANGWYESGAVTDVLIRHNTFNDP